MKGDRHGGCVPDNTAVSMIPSLWKKINLTFLGHSKLKQRWARARASHEANNGLRGFAGAVSFVYTGVLAELKGQAFLGGFFSSFFFLVWIDGIKWISGAQVLVSAARLNPISRVCPTRWSRVLLTIKESASRFGWKAKQTPPSCNAVFTLRRQTRSQAFAHKPHVALT